MWRFQDLWKNQKKNTLAYEEVAANLIDSKLTDIDLSLCLSTIPLRLFVKFIMF